MMEKFWNLLFGFTSYNSPTDPYPKELAYFYKVVARNDSQQARLLKDLSENEKLEKFLDISWDENGNLERIAIKKGMEDSYEAMVSNPELILELN